MSIYRPLSAVAAALALLSGCASQAPAAPETPKNIIFMIGDGMGPAFTTGYRYYLAGEAGSEVTPTVFDQLLVGMAATYPDDNTWVTDSAASATALAAGVKSYNGAIGVDGQKLPVEGILAKARKEGWSTGVVATSQVNHATPAGFVAHVASRKMYDAIAEQYVQQRIADNTMLDLILGGGQRYFSRDPGGLAEQMAEQGYQQIWSMEDLSQLNQLPAMGLVADVAMPHAIDSDQPERLVAMTDKALSLMSSQEQGFFLLVEGSQIDWCGHANDIACAMAEMHDFAGAVERAKAFVDANPDTLLVITADHSTGGLTLGANRVYEWKPEVIAQVHASVVPLTQSLLVAPVTELSARWSEKVDFALTDTELAALQKAYGEGDSQLGRAVLKVINDRSFTGWTTGGHTAVDVPVMAYGAGAEAFIGYQDNIEIPQRMMSLMGW
ncbi:alkaline phosphatase [Ferrimonas balearica]|uniref:alkaline phosphatase n=1 Tax=Ferrimonas balearica TaxID=44012 RepID=UPI001C966F19|nr:alkaline phosphatase [Ferrimonas balearica]MBY6105991.1 alkaline phosphatase [Ferrimonas balearica]